MFNCKKQNIAVFLMLLAVVMLLPCSSVLFAIERKSDKVLSWMTSVQLEEIKGPD